MKLRPYQNEAIHSIIKDHKKSNKLIISLATGTGKTIIFSTLINSYLVSHEKKVLILAHREELLEQAKEKIKIINPKLVCCIDQGSRQLTPIDYRNAHIIIASVATIGRKDTERIKMYDPEDFSGIVVDEVHHCIATTYIRVFEYFGVSKYLALPETKDKNPELEKEELLKITDWNKDCLLLGVTATPFRAKQNESLKHVFDKLSYKYDLIDGIKDGYLANIQNLIAVTGTSLEGVKMKGKEYQTKDLANRVNNEGRNRFIVETYLEKAQEGATLVFTTDKQHNNDLSQAFTDSGIENKIIDSDTPKLERKQILEDFSNNKLPVLLNVGILTEGYDAPNIMNILLARPTRSIGLYLQMIGRGTRLDEGKEKVVIIDFVDNSSKHNPMSLRYVIGIPGSDKIAEEKEKGDILEIDDLIEELEQLDETGADVLQQLAMDTPDYSIIDKGLILDVTKFISDGFIGDSKFTWFKILDDSWFLPFPNYTNIETKVGVVKFGQSRLKLVQEWEEWKLIFEGKLMDKTEIKTEVGSYSSIRLSDQRVSDFIVENDIEQMFLVRNQRWHKDLCSDGQKTYIMNLLAMYDSNRKIDIQPEDLEDMSKGEAGIIINILKYEANS